MNDLTPGYLCERFQHRSKIHQRKATQNIDLTLLNGRLATGQRAFAFRGAKIYNNLSKHTRDTKSLSVLKDGAYYCYCAYVLRIARYSGFLWVVPTNTGIFLRGLKLYGESRTYQMLVVSQKTIGGNHAFFRDN